MTRRIKKVFLRNTWLFSTPLNETNRKKKLFAEDTMLFIWVRWWIVDQRKEEIRCRSRAGRRLFRMIDTHHRRRDFHLDRGRVIVHRSTFADTPVVGPRIWCGAPRLDVVNTDNIVPFGMCIKHSIRESRLILGLNYRANRSILVNIVYRDVEWRSAVY